MFIEATHGAAFSRAMEYDAEAALAHLMRHRGPASFVVGQLGQSLDGRIATPNGMSKYINGNDALCHLHRIRAHCDAVVVGVGTAIADNPMLTTRHVPGPSPVRVVIDPWGRLPDDIGMLQDGATEVLVITRPGMRVARGAVPVEVPCDQGRICPHELVAALAGRGLSRVLIEGGADTLARFIDAGALDELHLMVAPIVIGSGKTGLNLAPIDDLAAAIRPRVRTMRFRDGDLLCLCEMGREHADLQRFG